MHTALLNAIHDLARLADDKPELAWPPTFRDRQGPKLKARCPVMPMALSTFQLPPAEWTTAAKALADRLLGLQTETRERPLDQSQPRQNGHH
jgi:hypothetical protein